MNTDGRAKSAVREDRAHADRSIGDRSMMDREVTDRVEVSDAVRLQMFRDSFSQASLPDLPEIPGYHVCWLTTSNPADPIARRIQLGFSPVTEADVAGWWYATEKSATVDGWIAVNEMRAAKIPLKLWESYMRIAHAEKPAEEEARLQAALDNIREQAERAGGRVIDMEIAGGA